PRLAGRWHHARRRVTRPTTCLLRPPLSGANGSVGAFAVQGRLPPSAQRVALTLAFAFASCHNDCRNLGRDANGEATRATLPGRLHQRTNIRGELEEYHRSGRPVVRCAHGRSPPHPL